VSGVIASAVFTLDTGRGTVPVDTYLSWSADDPLAVIVRFEARRVVKWHLARELLFDGLSVPAGVGDVLVRPDLDGGLDVTVIIRSPDGVAQFRVEHSVLLRFLEATFEQVPLGCEKVEVPDSDDPRWAGVAS
jgi:hypothetical protein